MAHDGAGVVGPSLTGHGNWLARDVYLEDWSPGVRCRKRLSVIADIARHPERRWCGYALQGTRQRFSMSSNAEADLLRPLASSGAGSVRGVGDSDGRGAAATSLSAGLISGRALRERGDIEDAEPRGTVRLSRPCRPRRPPVPADAGQGKFSRSTIPLLRSTRRVLALSRVSSRMPRGPGLLS